MTLPAASSFTVDPVLLGIVAGVAAAGIGLLRRGLGGARAGARGLALAGGVMLLVAAWASPLATLAQHYLLSAHLLQLLVVMGPVPALLLLALPRDPRWRLSTMARRVARILVNPIVTIIAVNAAFFGWHLTGTLDAALQHPWLYDLMQMSLLSVSIAFWWPVITPFSPPVRALTAFGKLGYIVLATIPQTLGGIVVALAGRVLYPAYGAGPVAIGIDPMTDQQIAGASIALVSKIALLTAFTVVFMRLLSTDPDIDASDGEGGGGGGVPQEDAPHPAPSGVPRWVEDASAGRTVEEAPAPRRSPTPVRVPAGSMSPRARSSRP